MRSRINSLIQVYRRIGPNTLNLIAAELFLQLINAAFFMVMLIQLNKCGFQDYQSAEFVSFRFLGVILTAIPIGIGIKGKPLIPYFYLSSICVPILTVAILIGVDLHQDWIIRLGMFFWGIFYNLIAIVVNPYILRNCPKEVQSEAFALSYATGSIGSILCGIISFALLSFSDIGITEREVMYFVAILSTLGLTFLRNIDKKEQIQTQISHISQINYNWKLIFKALIPTIIIAIGAGFTIPFVNLFFFHVHQIDTKWISIIGTLTSLLVSILALLVPNFLKKYGYRKAISGTQIVAVILLILFATTEYYSNWHYAGLLAALFYMGRQPLMNMSAPMTTELVLNYVGPNNKEIISALTSAIWSGSWFFSSWIFKILREMNHAYVQIFLITGAMYTVGVFLYYRLIIEYEGKLKS